MKIEKPDNLLDIARKVISSEIDSLKRMAEKLDENFEKAVALIQNRQGRVVVIGMGKSGIIGRKIAATLASTGTSAFFVHPGEAFHGDLGMIKPSDVAMLISNSGETEEIIRLLPFFDWRGNKTIALTGKANSTLAKHCDIVLNVSVEREACNNNLAPTNSTTATLVMGDALAVTLSTLAQFQPEDFARFHPGGSLGRRLITKVKDLMHATNLPVCSRDTGFMQVVHTITAGRLGIAVIVDQGYLTGVITDGDLRRSLERSDNPKSLCARDFMTTHPKTIGPDALFSSAVESMQEAKVNCLIVTNQNNEVLGILDVHGK